MRYHIVFFITVLLMICSASHAFASTKWTSHTSSKVNTIRQSDEAGDTFGASSWQPDLSAFSVHYTESTITFDIAFHNDISLNPADPNHVTGYLDLDTDQNSPTGSVSFSHTYSPYAFNLGIEFYIHLDAGQAWVFSVGGYLQSIIQIHQINSRMLQFSFPLSVLADNGALRAALVVGSDSEATDTIPNGGYILSEATVAMPAIDHLGILAMTGLLAAALLLIRRRTV